MPTAITWVVEQMDCYPQADGQTDVVFTVHWRANAVNGTYYATSYGAIGVTYVAGSPYTPYADLTQSQVVGWVKTAMGMEQVDLIEASLTDNIANQISPPVVSPPLPWIA